MEMNNGLKVIFYKGQVLVSKYDEVILKAYLKPLIAKNGQEDMHRRQFSTILH